MISPCASRPASSGSPGIRPGNRAEGADEEPTAGRILLDGTHVEPHGSAGVNRVPAMVERLIYLGAATQVTLRLATGESLQAVVSNEDASAWSQGTPVHAYLPPDALRVLAGDAAPAVTAEAPLAS